MPGVMLAQLAPLGSPPNRATAGILFPEEKTGKEKKTGQLSGSSGATRWLRGSEGEECRQGQWEESGAPTTCTLRGSTWVSLAVRPLPVCPKQLPPSRRVLVECL